MPRTSGQLGTCAGPGSSRPGRSHHPSTAPSMSGAPWEAAGQGCVPTRHTWLDLSYCRKTSPSSLPSPGICLECPTLPFTNLRVPRPRGQPRLLLGADNSQQEEFHPLSFAASLGSSSLGQGEECACGCPKLLRNLVDAGSPRTGSGLSPDPGPTGGR